MIAAFDALTRACAQLSATIATAVAGSARNAIESQVSVSAGTAGSRRPPSRSPPMTTTSIARPVTVVVCTVASSRAWEARPQRANNTRCSAQKPAASTVSASPLPNPAPCRLSIARPAVAITAPSQTVLVGRSRNNSQLIIGAITTSVPIRNPAITASVSVIAQACSRNPAPSRPPSTIARSRNAPGSGGRPGRLISSRTTVATPNRHATRSAAERCCAASSTTVKVMPQVMATPTRARTGSAAPNRPAGMRIMPGLPCRGDCYPGVRTIRRIRF